MQEMRYNAPRFAEDIHPRIPLLLLFRHRAEIKPPFGGAMWKSVGGRRVILYDGIRSSDVEIVIGLLYTDRSLECYWRF